MERDRAREYERATRGAKGRKKRERETVISRVDLIGGIPAEEIPLITERQAGTYLQLVVRTRARRERRTCFTTRYTQRAALLPHLARVAYTHTSRFLFLSLFLCCACVCVCETHVYADINSMTAATTKTERTRLLVPWRKNCELPREKNCNRDGRIIPACRSTLTGSLRLRQPEPAPIATL